MADGEGALVAQQTAADRIPYENIAANQKGLEFALGSFFHAANISLQRSKIEEALQKAQLETAEQARWHDIEMKNMQQNAATRIFAMGLREQSMNDRFGAMADRLQFAKDQADGKVADQTTALDSYSNLASGLKSAKPGSQDFYDRYFDVLADPDNQAGLNTPQGRSLARISAVAHNINTTRQWDKLNADKAKFIRNAQTEIWGSDAPSKPDLTPLQFPDMWKDQVRDADGNLVAPGTPGATSTGNKFIPFLDAKGNTKFRTLPSSKVNELVKGYQSFSDQKAQIPQQIVTTDVQPMPSSTSIGATQAQDLTNQISLAQRALMPGSGASDRAQAGARAFLQAQGQAVNGQ